MPLKLRNNAFKRDSSREPPRGLKRIPATLKELLQDALIIFFTPALAISSVFVPTTLTMLANLTVALGYIAEFFVHAYQKSIHPVNLVLTTLGIFGCIFIGGFYFAPIVKSTNIAVKILSFASHMATVLNIFLLSRKICMPFISAGWSIAAKKLGFTVSEDFMKYIPLDKDNPRDTAQTIRLLENENNRDDALKRYNNLGRYFTEMHNSYLRRPFGNIAYRREIKGLKADIKTLVIRGKVEDGFARVKRSRKKSKIITIEKAIASVKEINKTSDLQVISTLFKGKYNDTPIATIKHEALEALKRELNRQQGKLERIEACLPPRVP